MTELGVFCGVKNAMRRRTVGCIVLVNESTRQRNRHADNNLSPWKLFRLFGYAASV